MRVLVIRHSTAVDPYAAATDETRWLTEAGRRRIRRIGKLLASEAPPTRIFVSPLVRAVQTAEALASEVGLDGPIQATPVLAPDHGTTAQVSALLDGLDDGETVALVSHAPKVRVLAGHLAGESSIPGFRTGSVCAILGGTFEFWVDPEGPTILRDLSSIPL